VYRFGGHWRVLMLRYGVGNVVMVAVLWVALPYYPTDAHQLVRVLALLGLCVAGGGAYAAGLLAMGFRPRHIAKV
jgi:putative peptidoglycan lipid II flippase